MLKWRIYLLFISINIIKVLLKQNRIPKIVNVPSASDLTDLKMITFFILILLHTVSKIGIYGLLYILTYSL